MGVGAQITEGERLPIEGDKFEQERGDEVGGGELHDSPSPPPRLRETWSRQLEFTLACVGYAVGLGNVWRFPYLCYRSGGGAFLIPYLIMVLLCGIPLLLMEFIIGQYTSLGPVRALAEICPLLKGVGVATVVISFLLCTYYNVIITWALYYLFNSFWSTLPWQSCNNTWNIVENCSDGFPGNATHLKSASQQFFDYRLLEMSDGIEELGSIRWNLFGLLILAWIIVYFCIFKGVKSSGKVVYFTAIFPYVILMSLLINNIQLPGAKEGILFFLTPQWSQLLNVQLHNGFLTSIGSTLVLMLEKWQLQIAKVWVNAAAQVFNSIGIGFGSMLSMASYNKFNNNILKDTLVVVVINAVTSIFAGLVIFSAIGYMSYLHKLPVEDIATDGPGLVFVVYPEAFVTMPIAPMWATLFFFMLLCLGVDSQFAMVEVMVVSLMDSWGKRLLRFFRYKELVVLAVCFVAFLLGIPNVTKGGIYFFQLMDHYTAMVSLMFLAFFEVVAICWIYGVRRLCANYKEMLGTSPIFFFKLCWWFFAPFLLTVILISSIIRYTPARYGKTYTYPPWAEGLGWTISFCSIIWIPLAAVHTLYTSKGSFIQRLRSSLSPVSKVIPAGSQEEMVKLKLSCSVIHTNRNLAKEYNL